MAAPVTVAPLVAAALAASAAAAPAARVDLAARVVVCTGRAAPTLEEEVEHATVTRGRTARVARERARRACLEALRGVPTAGGGTVGARLDRDPRAAAAVGEAIRRARTRPPARLFADGGVEVDLVVPLEGAWWAELQGGAPAAGPSSPPAEEPSRRTP